tara:strand:- start:565 stop:771 length:207 start_codon:yes stop_codon:yes gene_type:complete
MKEQEQKPNAWLTMTPDKDLEQKREIRKIILRSLNNFFETQSSYDVLLSRQLLAKDIEENLHKENKIK